MKPFNTFWGDIKKGKNIEVYVTIVISLVVAVLGFIKIVNLEAINSTILAILGLIGVLLLGSRKKFDILQEDSIKFVNEFNIIKQKILLGGSISEFLTSDYPDLSEEFKNAKAVKVLGSNMSSTIVRFYSDYSKLLKRRGKIQFLINDPTPATLKMLTFRSTTINTVDAMESVIRTSFHKIATLSESAQNPDNIQVRMIPDFDSFGMIIIEHADGTSYAYIRHYSYKGEGITPTYKLSNENDDYWFSFYFGQFDKLWEQGKPFNNE